MTRQFIYFFFTILMGLHCIASPHGPVFEFKTLDELLFSLLAQIKGPDHKDIQSLKHLSTQRLKERLFVALEHESQKSIFLTDLDRTLVQSENYIGRVEWFWDYHAPLHRSRLRELNPQISHGELEKLIDKEFWNFTRERPQVTEVDREYSQLLSELQERGHVVMGLTARGTDLMPTTLRQLQNLGLRFGAHAESFLDQVRSTMDLPVAGSAVIFAEMNESGSTKGEILSILNRAAANYAHIFFFDDRDREIKSALQAREKYNIPANKLVIGKSRLSEASRRRDPHHKRFYSVALIQEEALQKQGRWISNQQAMNILIQTYGLKLYRCFDLFYITD